MDLFGSALSVVGCAVILSDKSGQTHITGYLQAIVGATENAIACFEAKQWNLAPTV